MKISRRACSRVMKVRSLRMVLRIFNLSVGAYIPSNIVTYYKQNLSKQLSLFFHCVRYIWMKSVYPLKKAQPANLVQPLIKYLQINDSPQAAMSMRDTLSQINQLRNKATMLDLPSEPTDAVIDKYINVLEMYVKYAKMIAKHFNWSTQFGNIVQDCNITWYDSFNPQLKYMKSEIHFDIFCCYYNLGVMYFYKAVNKCMEDLMSSMKEAMQCGKRAAFYFNQMRTVFYPGFINTGFSDTNYPHLELLEALCLGIVYKCMFNLFKDDQYKHGIHKIASLAVMAQQNFYKGYQIATQFFMKSSNISNNIKNQLLSFAYVESLYHDVVANAKYGKYYENQMDTNKEHIVLLIAYQKKGLRLLNIGLNNEHVAHLLDQRPEQKKELLKIKPQLEASYNQNVNRNKQIYKKPEIPEEKMPPAMQPPKEYIVKLSEPAQIALEYDNKNTAPFAKLIDNQTKAFSNQLKDFSQNRINGLESAYTKLQKNIQLIYNNCYVNYYLNLENQTQQKGIPENLQKKLDQIAANGGKDKINMEVGIIKKSQELAAKSFQNLRNLMKEEEHYDQQKRNQYQNQWKRPLSNIANKSYLNQLENYEQKATQANQVNKKIIEKYENLQKFIAISSASEAEIVAFLPKVEVTKFLQENKNEFTKLKDGTAEIKKKMEGLDNITHELRNLFAKIEYSEMAQKFFKEAQDNKEAVLDKIFGKAYKMIQMFNEKAKRVEEEAKEVGEVSTNLNNKNKGGDENTKRDFEVVMKNFGEVNNLFRDLTQGTSFYTKLNDILSRMDEEFTGFVTSRKIEADEIEQSLGRGKGNFGGPSLPSMYPNQAPPQNFGFYVPPPMSFGNQPPQNVGFSTYQQPGGNNESMGDMLHNLMASKPNFDANIFGGNDKIYQSRYK